MRALWVVSLLVLAGCLGGSDSTTPARSAYDASQAAVDGTFEYALFLGITGTEGPLDWQAYEEDQRAQGGQAKRLADTFDQDVANGKFGDGQLGAWMTTHFAYDEDRRLVGGLFTQVKSNGDRHALFAPFTGPYSGTTAYANVGHRAMVEQAELLQQEGPVLCALQTRVDNWHVSSAQAAAAALGTQTMQEHLAKYPDGELTYYYFPELGVEDGCQASIQVASNYWTIFHTDLDAYLDASSPLPSVANVRVDAATGEVLSAFVEPLVFRAPSLIDQDLNITDPLLPGWQTHTIEIDVKEGATILELQSHRRAAPPGLAGDQTILRDPEGRPTSNDFTEPLHHYVIEEPLAGTWSFEYQYHAAMPGGEHLLSLIGAVVYP